MPQKPVQREFAAADNFVLLHFLVGSTLKICCSGCDNVGMEVRTLPVQ